MGESCARSGADLASGQLVEGGNPIQSGGILRPRCKGWGDEVIFKCVDGTFFVLWGECAGSKFDTFKKCPSDLESILHCPGCGALEDVL